ncbi:hypothetical protein V5799_021344 [Amblyomma americanum]|uniref:Uncharacterized protein n=1 Tax=Amblyomma americanum TaxID=6943 RepID=A0AAQ4FP76_AMBAM
MSQFGIPKRRRLRADATPTVFAHRSILQAKRRGAFEKRQRKEIIEALLRDSNTVDTQEEASSSSSQPPESDSVEFSDKSTAGTLPEESGMAECSSNVQYSLPVSVSCDTGKSAVQQCSIFVQVALRASCCSTGIQTAPKAVSSSTQTVGTFCDKRNSSVQTEGADHTYEPSVTDSSTMSLDPASSRDLKKFIVFEDGLLELFQRCFVCLQSTKTKV